MARRNAYSMPSDCCRGSSGNAASASPMMPTLFCLRRARDRRSDTRRRWASRRPAVGRLDLAPPSAARAGLAPARSRVSSQRARPAGGARISVAGFGDAGGPRCATIGSADFRFRRRGSPAHTRYIDRAVAGPRPQDRRQRGRRDRRSGGAQVDRRRPARPAGRELPATADDDAGPTLRARPLPRNPAARHQERPPAARATHVRCRLRRATSPSRSRRQGTIYDHRAHTATPVPAAQTSQQQFIQYYRRLPHLILRQALDRANSLRYLGEDMFEGRRHHVVTFVMADTQQIALYIDAKTASCRSTNSCSPTRCAASRRRRSSWQLRERRQLKVPQR